MKALRKHYVFDVVKPVKVLKFYSKDSDRISASESYYLTRLSLQKGAAASMKEEYKELFTPEHHSQSPSFNAT
jgi:hypothetical protein